MRNLQVFDFIQNKFFLSFFLNQHFEQKEFKSWKKNEEPNYVNRADVFFLSFLIFLCLAMEF